MNHEYRERRQRLAAEIGPGAIAVFQGANGLTGADAFRQYNDVYYLSGIEVPGLYLTIEGGTGNSTVFLLRESQLDRQSAGPLICAENGDFVRAQTGIDAVRGIEFLALPLSRASIVYTCFEDGQTRGVNRHCVESWTRQLSADPWDTRNTRAAEFANTVRSRFPQVELRNASPVLDEMRLIKSPAEVNLMRHAGTLCAEAVCDAMRATQSGVMEYQLDAVMRYRYLNGGAIDRGYAAIVSSGENILYPHYHRNECELRDGSWLLCDCAPDYQYYTSDIGRMWPISGTYSDRQRSLYGYVVEYHKAFLAAIRPGSIYADLYDEVIDIMRPVFDTWTFVSESDRAAAAKMFDFRHHLSHAVGLSVHDGFGHYRRPLEPGMVFSVDPTLTSPEHELYVRVEDTIVMTEDGFENLTSAAPLELDDVETIMREDGMLQAFPPCPPS
ncbi:MAG: Xaa-Pro aminopeptidase [Rhodothermales bacterium]|jgi:Xaa-Pro aminopeptidase